MRHRTHRLRRAMAAPAAALALLGSCVSTPRATTPATASTGTGCCAAALADGLRLARRHRVDAITERRFTHADFWRAVAPSLASPALRTAEIGRSMQGRELRAVTFGQGPTTVLLWSQMHGDESTATMALADVFRFLAEGEADPLHARLRRELTVTFVPMLNPDGAELFQRENAAGVDINRDARRLTTPEARALKGLRDRLKPDFGFNLHDQSARTRVGPGGPQAAIALLAPPADAARGYGEVRARARLVASTIAQLLSHDIPGRVAKYDDSFNPRAFGDLMQQWGTSTVLVESGALPNDPQKQRLRALNVAAILGALDAIATGSYASAGAVAYDALPYNTGGATDLLIVGGQLVLPDQPPMPLDVSVNFDDAVAGTRGRVRDVGDLRGVVIALDTLDATGLYLHAAPTSLTGGAGGRWLRIGAPADIEVRRGPQPTSALVRRVNPPENREPAVPRP